MPQWTVEGANKATGADTTLLIEAPTESAARTVAASQGLAVASVSPSDQHLTEPPRALDYQPAVARHNLTAVSSAARVLFWLACIAYLAAVIECAGQLLSYYTNTRISPNTFFVQVVSNAIFQSLKTAMIGAFLQVAAALLPVLAERLATPKR